MNVEHYLTTCSCSFIVYCVLCIVAVSTDITEDRVTKIVPVVGKSYMQWPLTEPLSLNFDN